MGEKKNTFEGRIQVGISSLILIFTVLCMVVFAVLSLASAAADQKLAKKNAAHIEAFYRGDREAEMLLREVNQRVVKAAQTARSSFDHMVEAEAWLEAEPLFHNALSNEFGEIYHSDHHSLEFYVQIDEEQALSISLELKPLDEIVGEKENYTVASWKVENVKDYEIDQKRNVWTSKE